MHIACQRPSAGGALVCSTAASSALLSYASAQSLQQLAGVNQDSTAASISGGTPGPCCPSDRQAQQPWVSPPSCAQ